MMWLASLLWSCNPQTTDKALVQNIAKGLAECREDQINLLVQKNNIQTAFDYCGENSFNSFRWSADGSKLFFGYYGKSYIQDGELEVAEHLRYLTTKDENSDNETKIKKIAIFFCPPPQILCVRV